MKASQLVRALAVLGGFAVLTPAAMAQLANATVATTVNLTSVCRWQGGTTPTGTTVDFGAYTAFQAGAKTATSTTVTYECTRSFGAALPTVTWDAVATVSDAAGNGQVGGLSYTLSASAVKTGGNAPTLAVPLGTADTVVITLGGSMPGGQAGTGPSGAATANRTLIVAY